MSGADTDAFRIENLRQIVGMNVPIFEGDRPTALIQIF